MLKTLLRPNFWVVFLGDALLVALSLYLAYLIRFDGNITNEYFGGFVYILPWAIAIKLSSFFFFGLYKGMWRYTGLYDLENLIKACLVGSGIIVFIIVVKSRFYGFPRSVFIIDFLLTFLFVAGARVGIRLFLSSKNGPHGFSFFSRKAQDKETILIVGAGDAGEKLIREIKDNPSINYNVAGIVDDDIRKRNQTIHGVTVLGILDDVKKISEKMAVDEIMIAISAATAVEMRRVVGLCEATGLPCKTLPGVGELIEGKVSVRSIRKVRYEDLLGRRQIPLNLNQIGEYLTDKRVMVTGGCGSIGSELCRQIVRFGPKKLIVVDINESGLFDMEMDFKAKLPHMEIIPVLSPIQDRHVMPRVFDSEQPEVVFHAAAYKHVPMLEMHPWEAVLNNILGTQNILELCSSRNVRRCVVVSTDKAVRPTNVMGASKRVTEILAQLYAFENGARNMCVRFGNVIYSAGSVVPLFRKQIERGGPVTLTHQDVVRYFMTIPEASRLILQAGAIGTGGEIFILKMGDPIRIADMARDLIRLSGFEPDKDIEIKEIGLRPGEKLFEELITEGEGIQQTEHEEIMVLRSDMGNVGASESGVGSFQLNSEMGLAQNDMTLKKMKKHVKRLVSYAESGDGQKIREELKRIVPEYEYR